ncbi:MAG: hypothetical protein ACYS9X_00380 [Planctomycetota bacterium]
MRWIWRALTRRLLLKFVALLCAGVLWVYVDSFLSESKVLLVELEAFTPDPGGSAILVSPRTVRVTIRGPAKQLALVDPDDVDCRAHKDARVPGGLSRIQLSGRDFSLPDIPGIRVVDFEPREITVSRQPSENGAQ